MTELLSPLELASAESGRAAAVGTTGTEGFREFSGPRGVVVRGIGDLADAFLPACGPMTQAIVDSVFDAAGRAGAAASEGD